MGIRREITFDRVDEKKIANDIEAKRIDDIFEQRQQAKKRMGIPERIPK